MITTANPLTVTGLSKAEEAKVSEILQSMGTTPADFLVKLLRIMARTGIVPLLVDPSENLTKQESEEKRAIALDLAPLESLGISYPHTCQFDHTPNKETVEFLLLPDSEKEYETFSGFEEWYENMKAVTK